MIICFASTVALSYRSTQVSMDCLFRVVWNIPVMEKVIKERFNGKYPAWKSIQTNFAHVGGPDGLQFQADAVAYCGTLPAEPGLMDFAGALLQSGPDYTLPYMSSVIPIEGYCTLIFSSSSGSQSGIS